MLKVRLHYVKPVAVLIFVMLCYGSAPVRAQVAPDPSAPAASSDNSDDTATPAPPKPQIDPKTGLPINPADVRDQEIDQHDPLKTPAPPAEQKDQSGADKPGSLQQPADDRRSATPKTTGDEPLPGSIAASNAANKNNLIGADTIDSPDAGAGGYNGPAVLTRSYTLARPMTPQQIRWHLAFAYIQSAGFGNPQPPAEGQTTASPSSVYESESISWSASGRHIWRHDQAGFAWSSGTSFANQSNVLRGSNNSFNIDYEHVFSRKMSAQFVESLQFLSQNYSLQNPTYAPGVTPANLNLAISPETQLLNQSIKQSSSQVSLTYQKTARLSFNVAASYILVSYGTNGTGTTGRQVSGDVNYRLTRKTTIGVSYAYTNYRYSHDVSNSDAHTIGLIYSYALTRTMQLRANVGGTQFESLGYALVPVPAQLAPFLGTGATIADVYSHRRVSSISAQLVKDFGRTRTSSISYSRSLSPGNGLLLTSMETSIGANYGMSVLRHIPITSGLTYVKLSSAAGGIVADSRSEAASISTSRQFPRRRLTVSLIYSYQLYKVANTPITQHNSVISVSFGWSPPDNSLQFWK